MPSLPPAASAPPPAPAPPAAAPQHVRWAYVDQARTHEVHVGLRGGGGAPIVFFVLERGSGGDAFEETHTLEQLWESQVHHLALEERLTLLGGYFRHSVGAGGGWVPVRRPPSSWTLDLTPLAAPGLPPDAQLHFYGSATDSYTTLLLAVPVRGAGGPQRHALARLDVAFPDAAGGRLTLLHASLGPALLRSALASQDQQLHGLRLQKVVHVDRQAPRNAAWCGELDACVAAALARMASGAFGGTAPRPPAPPAAPAPRPAAPLPRPVGAAAAPAPVVAVGRGGGRGPLSTRVITQGAEPVRLQAPPKEWKMPARLMTDDNPYAIEYDPEPEQAAGDAAEVAKIEESTLDLAQAIAHPRILALHTQFFAPGEDESLVAAGELAIRAAVQGKRGDIVRERQHLLSIVEASLLVRHSLAQRGRRLDPHAADLLRRALVYLGGGDR